MGALMYDSSLSIRSDDSDFEFGAPDACIDGQDPPASPRLSYSPWDSSASSCAASPAHSYAAAPTAFVIDAAQSRYPCTEAPKSHSEEAIDDALAKQKNLKSLMLQRRELDQLPPLASARSATVPQRSARTSIAMGSPSSYSATPSPLPSLKYSSSPVSGKKTRRWSLGLDFLHSKRASPQNAVSPSASPLRTPAADHLQSSAGYGHSAPPSPMSPHAQHYQQQRVRAQELRRRTNLPYHQNFLGSCFFPSQVASY